MKIVKPDHIKDCEESMFSALKQDLDMDSVLEFLKGQVRAGDIQISRGEMKLSGDEIVYQLDLAVTMHKRVVFDREGNILKTEKAGLPAISASSREKTLPEILLENQEFWENLS